MKSPADVRSERVKTFVAPIVPAATVGLALATSLIWLANWLRGRPNLDRIALVLAAELALLLLAAWYIRRVAREGRVEATGIGMIGTAGVISVSLCLVTYYNGNGVVQSMPLCVMIPLVAIFFWPRDWHFAVGTLVTLVPPLAQLFLTEHTRDERFMLTQLAGTTIAVSVVIYAGMRRANRSSARMAADLEYRAAYDGLTGLYNRAHWFDRATTQYAACRTAGRPASLLFLDLDRFKQHNDRAGHVEGDRLLREVAGALAELSAADHLLGRFGGDEFIAFLPDTAQEEAIRLAERIGEAVARIETADGTLRVSIGAIQAEPGENLDQFISRADSAMFAAKSAAGDRAPYLDPPERHHPLTARARPIERTGRPGNAPRSAPKR